MKFQQLKEKFKSKYTMRMMAGALCVILAGGSLGAYSLRAEKKTVDVAVLENQQKDNGKDSQKAEMKKAANKSKQESKNGDNDGEDALTEKIISMLEKDKKANKNPETLDGKEETVYIIADANGNANKTIVSSWLKNGSKASEISDVSSLSDIENVKGDETFTKNGDKISWQANGNDIYYKGTTTDKAPVSEKITYYLDGKKISPQKLAGRSGKVTVRFDYTNRAKTSAKINGKKEEVYVPFTIMSGMILDDSFRNIRVNNGKVLSDGNRNVVVGFAMPGLKENLAFDEEDFDENFEFPEYVEVTADVENFSLEMTATIAITGLLSDAEITDKFDLSELDDTLDEMSDAMEQLKDGGNKLTDGLNTLDNSMGEFSSGVGSLKDGVDAYTDGASRLAAGIQTLSDGSGTLENGVNTLNSSAKTLNEGVQKLDQTLKTEMSEKEKAAAKQEVGQSIEAQFQEGSATYQMIYSAATENFSQTMTNDATVQTVQAGIQAGMQSQGLTSEGVVAALAEYYAANGFTDGTGKTYPPQVCQSVMPGTETPYAVYFASSVLNGGLSSALAGGITSGIASQGAAAVGTSVVDACESAAKLAGETAAISGAESAKKQIVSAIEQKDANTGYSLVSGMQALSAGTQQLADSVPALKDGIAQLQNGANELVTNNGALKDGVSKLADGTSQISDGARKLKDGAKELSDGLEEFDEKAISKVVDAYNGDVKDLMERVKAIVRAGEDYRTFCGAADSVEATTKFIFRTDAIKAGQESE